MNETKTNETDSERMKEMILESIDKYTRLSEDEIERILREKGFGEHILKKLPEEIVSLYANGKIGRDRRRNELVSNRIRKLYQQ